MGQLAGRARHLHGPAQHSTLQLRTCSPSNNHSQRHGPHPRAGDLGNLLNSTCQVSIDLAT
eukprot:4324791-Alexandrium_andersonii.AAC.1